MKCYARDRGLRRNAGESPAALVLAPHRRAPDAAPYPATFKARHHRHQVGPEEGGQTLKRWNSDGSGWAWTWVLVGVLGMFCVAMMANMMRHGSSGSTQQDGASNSYERIRAERLARGEIEVEEYRRLRGALHRTSGPTAEAENPSRLDRHLPNA